MLFRSYLYEDYESWSILSFFLFGRGKRFSGIFYLEYAVGKLKTFFSEFVQIQTFVQTLRNFIHDPLKSAQVDSCITFFPQVTVIERSTIFLRKFTDVLILRKSVFFFFIYVIVELFFQRVD